jgi:hypothetical protein
MADSPWLAAAVPFGRRVLWTSDAESIRLARSAFTRREREVGATLLGCSGASAAGTLLFRETPDGRNPSLDKWYGCPSDLPEMTRARRCATAVSTRCRPACRRRRSFHQFDPQGVTNGRLASPLASTRGRMGSVTIDVYGNANFTPDPGDLASPSGDLGCTSPGDIALDKVPGSRKIRRRDPRRVNDRVQPTTGDSSSGRPGRSPNSARRSRTSKFIRVGRSARCSGWTATS